MNTDLVANIIAGIIGLTFIAMMALVFVVPVTIDLYHAIREWREREAR